MAQSLPPQTLQPIVLSLIPYQFYRGARHVPAENWLDSFPGKGLALPGGGKNPSLVWVKARTEWASLQALRVKGRLAHGLLKSHGSRIFD
jgi:hypothetical protein